MLLSPRHSSTLADLLRLLAVWLAVVVLLQGFAAVHARVAGPMHQHRSHGAGGLLAHRHHHDEAQRHHHAASDPTPATPAEAAALDEALDAAAAALAAAFLLLATAGALRARAAAGRVWCARPAWVCCAAPLPPLWKPPQRS